jgi:hypothetical protein
VTKKKRVRNPYIDDEAGESEEEDDDEEDEEGEGQGEDEEEDRLYISQGMGFITYYA